MKSAFKRAIANIIVYGTIFSVPSVASAAASDQTTSDIFRNLGQAARSPFGAPASGEANVSVGVVVGRLIQAVLGFTGMIALVILIYGGFMWLTARGNEDQVTKAKKYIQNAVIGIIIIITAFSVTYYLTDVVFKATL